MGLGIDFGTTRTVVAWADRGNYPIVSFESDSGDHVEWFPSVVAEREGVPADDPHARAAVDIVATVMRSTADRISDPRVAGDFGAALTDSLSAIRAVLSPPLPRKAHQ